MEESDRRRGRLVSSLSLSLTHPFWEFIVQHSPHTHTHTESMDSLPNSFNPNKRLKEEFVPLSLTLFHFSFYTCLLLIFFLLLLIWVFQIRDQFDWIVHARSLCPFNHSLCKSHILFLIHIYCYVLSIFSYCSDFSHRFSLFFATHFPPIAFSVIPTLCSLAL